MLNFKFNMPITPFKFKKINAYNFPVRALGKPLQIYSPLLLKLLAFLLYAEVHKVINRFQVITGNKLDGYVGNKVTGRAEKVNLINPSTLVNKIYFFDCLLKKLFSILPYLHTESEFEYAYAALTGTTTSELSVFSTSNEQSLNDSNLINDCLLLYKGKGKAIDYGDKTPDSNNSYAPSSSSSESSFFGSFNPYKTFTASDYEEEQRIIQQALIDSRELYTRLTRNASAGEGSNTASSSTSNALSNESGVGTVTTSSTGVSTGTPSMPFSSESGSEFEDMNLDSTLECITEDDIDPEVGESKNFIKALNLPLNESNLKKLKKLLYDKFTIDEAQMETGNKVDQLEAYVNWAKAELNRIRGNINFDKLPEFGSKHFESGDPLEAQLGEVYSLKYLLKKFETQHTMYQIKLNYIEEQLEELKAEILSALKKNNFVSSQIFLNFDMVEFFSLLPTDQLSIVSELLPIVLIFKILFILFKIIFRESIISYFELEKKFPKLATFLKIRRKLQIYHCKALVLGMIIIAIIQILAYFFI